MVAQNSCKVVFLSCIILFSNDVSLLLQLCFSTLFNDFTAARFKKLSSDIKKSNHADLLFSLWRCSGHWLKHFDCIMLCSSLAAAFYGVTCPWLSGAG